MTCWEIILKMLNIWIYFPKSRITLSVVLVRIGTLLLDRPPTLRFILELVESERLVLVTSPSSLWWLPCPLSICSCFILTRTFLFSSICSLSSSDSEASSVPSSPSWRPLVFSIGFSSLSSDMKAALTSNAPLFFALDNEASLSVDPLDMRDDDEEDFWWCDEDDLLVAVLSVPSNCCSLLMLLLSSNVFSRLRSLLLWPFPVPLVCCLRLVDFEFFLLLVLFSFRNLYSFVLNSILLNVKHLFYFILINLKTYYWWIFSLSSNLSINNKIL